LQHAVELIATDGYSALTMRAVARSSGLTLGALQYHFSTMDNLLHSLADYIGQQYRQSAMSYIAAQDDGSSRLHAMLDFVVIDSVQGLVMSDRLFPQLWAMGMVEPIMKELLDNLYEEYMLFLEACLEDYGITETRPIALAVMSMLEGFTLFVGQGARWQEHGPATLKEMHLFIDARLGT
jgi:AcrR family transcriptional regulator